ncbi:unnamed protein product [Caenorhabditis bovis]|uniref:Large ribosomal subunit protein uL14m n=1 Tax=Caenorhabditis bovis TaxID=2654633 RepID=A0A8S1EXW0_9PELO|nr:unnamed protein product [Caenorhabditis bovis]
MANLPSSSMFTKLLSKAFSPVTTSKCMASGRWYPQPDHMMYSTASNEKSIAQKSDDEVVVSPKRGVALSKADAAPVYAEPKSKGDGFELVEHKKGEMVANYTLFEASINKAKVPWVDYDRLTSEERTIHMAHMKAVNERKLHYKDPATGYTVFTISQHLKRGKCCGSGCRHCPYEHVNAPPELKASKVYELSKHRTRAPSMGIHRRTRLNVVDNSALGKEADAAGKLPYCIHVYKQGGRAKHMPHAVLGDKILVAIRGQMRKAYVVGANTHVHYRKHGVPSTDSNNIVLLDEEGNPLGNRVTSPIPTKLLAKRDNVQFSKVLALANKYI